MRARDDFQLGTSLVKQGQWSEALAAFERAGALRPHPITRFNIAVCQRALGRYMQARETFARALAENQAAGGTQLPETFLADTSAYMLQMEGLLATLTLAIQPASVRIAVDGRPLAQAQSATDRPRFVAGTRDAGPGETAPSGPFDVELDPGAHVITLSRKGYQDVVLNRTLAPGSKANFPVALSLLPATLHIRADKPGAVVTVDGLDVGVAPVDLSRPAGTYRVVLRKPGLLPYETKLAAGPGQHVYVTAPLVEDKPSVLKKWWFWTAAAAVVAGAVGTTYAVTRPEPTQTAPNGGGLGWAQKLP